ncbi:MAG: S23 ribosomal protein [Parcubacteria group bacterium Gr01-1014_72]|nr:MAG: S23 ribosomal protein [Parcubacteria group bacterium Gr01-1014_72]
MDTYVHFVYSLTKKFPRDEVYGVTSQFRRAALSIILNYIEGYARQREKVYRSFLEISYGSLRESRYLLKFSHEEGFINGEEIKKGLYLAEEIGAMLWGILRNLK